MRMFPILDTPIPEPDAWWKFREWRQHHALKKSVAKMNLPREVPWLLLEPYRESCIRLHGQTLEELAERGGLSHAEIYGHHKKLTDFTQVKVKIDLFIWFRYWSAGHFLDTPGFISSTNTIWRQGSIKFHQVNLGEYIYLPKGSSALRLKDGKEVKWQELLYPNERAVWNELFTFTLVKEFNSDPDAYLLEMAQNVGATDVFFYEKPCYIATVTGERFIEVKALFARLPPMA